MLLILRIADEFVYSSAWKAEWAATKDSGALFTRDFGQKTMIVLKYY